MTVSWNQSGNVDRYIVRLNLTTVAESDVVYLGLGTSTVTATVSNIMSGVVYSLSVAAVLHDVEGEPSNSCQFVTSEWILIKLVEF